MNMPQKEFQVQIVQSQSLSGSAVLDMIKSGAEGEAFEFDGCTFDQIDLSGQKLPPLKFVNCKFESSTCFANSVFSKILFCYFILHIVVTHIFQQLLSPWYTEW